MIYGFWAVQLYLKTVGYLIFFSFDWSRFKGFVGCLTPLDSCRVLNTFRSSVLFWLCDRYLTVQILASCFSRKCVQKSSGDGDIFELGVVQGEESWTKTYFFLFCLFVLLLVVIDSLGYLEMYDPSFFRFSQGATRTNSISHQ